MIIIALGNINGSLGLNSNKLKKLTSLVEILTANNKAAEDEIKNVKGQLEAKIKLSLENKRLTDRIKTSLYGMTVDWRKFKKHSKN